MQWINVYLLERETFIFPAEMSLFPIILWFILFRCPHVQFETVVIKHVLGNLAKADHE